MKGWEDYRALIGNQSSTQKKTRYFNRRLYQNTSLVRIDRSGRINIPEKLRQLAGLGKTALVIGVDQTIEIWSPERYETYLENFGQTYEEVAEELRRNE